MAELAQQAFSAINLPYTILMILVACYWLLVIVGLLDMELFDLTYDAGVDLDVDVNTGDMTELGESAGGFSILGFLNMGEVPIMFYASIVALCMWVNSVKMNQWFNPDGSTWFALALAIPNLMFAVLLAKVLLEPVKIYNRKRQRTSSLVGKVCVVKSQEINEGFGRCEVATDSAPIIVNARTENGEVLKQGDPAVIVRQLPEQGFHIVTKQNLE